MRNRILTGAVAIASVAAISFGTVSTASAAPAYKPYPHQIHNMVAPKAKISQGYFTSASPEHPKIYYKYNTVAKPKAAIVVVHGLAEHSGRYDSSPTGSTWQASPSTAWTTADMANQSNPTPRPRKVTSTPSTTLLMTSTMFS